MSKKKLQKTSLELEVKDLVSICEQPFPDYSEQALSVMKTHYIKRDLDGNYLESTPDEIFKRVSDFYRKNSVRLKDVVVDGGLDIFELVKVVQRHKLFTFNSPTYYNADPTKSEANMFACFVGNLGDSMDSIANELKRHVNIFKDGAGIGNNVGNLRPRGASIGDGGKHFQGESGSSGPLAFMTLFNQSGITVKAAGKRRAAIMSCLYDTHPDLLDFINCKSGPDREDYVGMNLSILVTDKFMKAVEHDDMWDLSWHSVVYKTVRAREIFELHCQKSWETGDPGWLFRNTINLWNATPSLGEIVSTNPCGEIPLPPSTSCNLASINLYQLALRQITKDKSGEFALDKFFDLLHDITKLIVPFLSENAFISKFPDEEFRRNTQFCCPMGLGISGFAELLFKIGVQYGSADSIALAKQIMEEITLTGFEVSADMAEVWGPCEAWKVKENSNALIDILSRFRGKSQSQTKRWGALIERIKTVGVRNMYVTALAPTGNTGLFSDSVSGGIEPVFSLHYKRNVTTGGTLEIVDPEFIAFCEEYFEDDDSGDLDELLEDITAAGGILTQEIRDAHELDDEFDHFVTAHNLDWKARIDMQAAFQEFCCFSISSTVNLPEETPVEVVREMVKYAHLKNLKGLTIYRDGSLPDTPLEKTGEKKKEEVKVKWSRPQELDGKTFHYTFDTKEVYITVNFDPDGSGRIREAFVTLNCDPITTSFSESLTRRVSGDLQRNDIPIESILQDLIGVPSGITQRLKIRTEDKKPALVTSIPDLLGQLLRRFSIDKQEIQHIPGAKRCSKCFHYTAIPEENCLKCVNPKCNYVDCSI